MKSWRRATKATKPPARGTKTPPARGTKTPPARGTKTPPASGHRNPDSFFLKRAHHGFGVLAIARLDEKLDLGRANRGRAEDPLVLHFDDVAACIRDQGGDLGEAPGHVLHGDMQAHEACIAHQAAHQD